MKQKAEKFDTKSLDQFTREGGDIRLSHYYTRPKVLF